MNYIGSKHSLLSFLEECITKVAGSLVDAIFCDIFAGTGAVGFHFKKLGYRVIANDLQYYSYALNRHYIGNNQQLKFSGLADVCGLGSREVLNYLNGLEGINGFVYNNYCVSAFSSRKYFTEINGKKCDAIRKKMDSWLLDKKICENEYFYLMASLIEAADRVANTASVYGAFLKEFKKTALREMVLTDLVFADNGKLNEVHNEDAGALIKKVKTDILYLDPPYNQRQYYSNYHVLETIARYDSPTLKGVTGLRCGDSQSSNYCKKTRVFKELDKLIQNADAKFIFLSYNNEGLLSFDEIKQVLSSRGEYGYFVKDYNRFKSDSKRINYFDKTKEYVHFCEIK